jgi:hypothetical protein
MYLYHGLYFIRTLFTILQRRKDMRLHFVTSKVFGRGKFASLYRYYIDGEGFPTIITDTPSRGLKCINVGVFIPPQSRLREGDYISTQFNDEAPFGKVAAFNKFAKKVFGHYHKVQMPHKDKPLDLSGLFHGRVSGKTK